MNGLVAEVSRFGERVIQDALTSATAETWRRRADDFEDARPREGDYTGRATAEDIAARDERLAAKAQACRRHAQIAQFEDFEDLYATVIAESADAESRAA